MDKNGVTTFTAADSYFVGHTNDLEHRLAAHERGYTLSRCPVELVFSDRFSTRQEAI